MEFSAIFQFVGGSDPLAVIEYVICQSSQYITLEFRMLGRRHLFKILHFMKIFQERREKSACILIMLLSKLISLKIQLPTSVLHLLSLNNGEIYSLLFQNLTLNKIRILHAYCLKNDNNNTDWFVTMLAEIRSNLNMLIKNAIKSTKTITDLLFFIA